MLWRISIREERKNRDEANIRYISPNSSLDLTTSKLCADQVWRHECIEVLGAITIFFSVRNLSTKCSVYDMYSGNMKQLMQVDNMKTVPILKVASPFGSARVLMK